MAIQRLFETKHVTLVNAYFRVRNVAGTKENLLAEVEIVETAKSTEAIAVLSVSFKPKMNNKNYHQQAYEYLKTLPDFANCVDC